MPAAMMTVPMLRRILFALSLTLALSGCAATVDYGRVPHGLYVKDGRCAPVDGAAVDGSALPLFLVTTRLPDCRSPDIQLTHHRGDAMRFGRFAPPPADMADADDAERLPPLAFQAPGDWWHALQVEAGARQGRVLLYVHGYRETFATTARDAAQIARMSGFSGPVISYSWPSQGKVLSYAVDETNIYYDMRNFRGFLAKLEEQPWVNEIIIVAHSLGARMLIPALEYVDRTSTRTDSSNISTIILASPDIDRETFERDIGGEILAPERVRRGRHLTIYVSAEDKALAASRAIHGYPRLGSPYCFNRADADALEKQGLPPRCYPAAIPGITIIDTSDVSRGTTGHSNFLRSAPACRDFIAVVQKSAAPLGRTATKFSHVFRLLPGPENPKPDDEMICNRDPDQP